MWQVIDTGKQSAEQNMEFDRALLEQLDPDGEPILHLYEWEEDAATYGHFIDPEKFLDIASAKKMRLSLAKRPTGGGIVFHICDLAFSVLVPASHPSFSPRPLDNYAFVNKHVIQAILNLYDLESDLLPKEPIPLDVHCRSFCMAKPTKYDVMIGGRKVGGAAQRKTRAGYLHQGTIALGLLPPTYLEKVLQPGTQVLEAMQENSFSLLGEEWDGAQLGEARQKMKEQLVEVFTR